MSSGQNTPVIWEGEHPAPVEPINLSFLVGVEEKLFPLGTGINGRIREKKTEKIIPNTN